MLFLPCAAALKPYMSDVCCKEKLAPDLGCQVNSVDFLVSSYTREQSEDHPSLSPLSDSIDFGISPTTPWQLSQLTCHESCIFKKSQLILLLS